MLAFLRVCSAKSSRNKCMLVVLTAEDTATAPDPANRTSEAITAVSSHGGLDYLQRLYAHVLAIAP
jgi:hypothetical protein